MHSSSPICLISQRYGMMEVSWWTGGGGGAHPTLPLVTAATGSHCVFGPQQWPQSIFNFRVSSATSVKNLYKFR
ncbi:unnamed protein product [Urochloa humidicola]